MVAAMSLVSRLLVAFQVCNTPMSMCVWVLMNGIDTDTGARSQTGAGSLSPSRRHSHFECLPSPLPGSDANHCRVNNRCSVALALTLPHPHTDRPRDSRRPSQLCRWLQNFISFWPGKLPISFRSEDFSKCVMHACVCVCVCRCLSVCFLPTQPARVIGLTLERRLRDIYCPTADQVSAEEDRRQIGAAAEQNGQLSKRATGKSLVCFTKKLSHSPFVFCCLLLSE